MVSLRETVRQGVALDPERVALAPPMLVPLGGRRLGLLGVPLSCEVLHRCAFEVAPDGALYAPVCRAAFSWFGGAR